MDAHLKLLPEHEPKPHAAARSVTHGTVVHGTIKYGCEDCLAMLRDGKATKWLHLRLCLTCGHVGCCDSSPHRHARQHACSVTKESHPIIRSYEPGERWRYCFVDEEEV